jgi:hypothetical protein
MHLFSPTVQLTQVVGKLTEVRFHGIRSHEVRVLIFM